MALIGQGALPIREISSARQCMCQNPKASGFVAIIVDNAAGATRKDKPLRFFENHFDPNGF
jgi:hypothetical protein